MKKLLSLILIASLIISLTSCNMLGEVEQANDSLTIYIDKHRGNPLKDAIYEYRLANSDIEINIVEIDGDDDYTKMRTEIMAKKGPDIILVNKNNFPDARKTMATGVFADLTPFFEDDETYNEDDYYQQIMEVGQYKGLQCLFPMTFTIPSIITTQEALDEYDLSFSDKPNLSEITEQSVKYINQNNSMMLFPNQTDNYSLNYFNVISDIIDYKTCTIDLDSEEFLKATRNFKEFYKTGNTRNKIVEMGRTHSTSQTANHINSSFLLYNTNYFYNNTVWDFITLSQLKLEQTPVTVPIYGFEGEINAKMDYGLAINNYSENKQNAYDFIRTALEVPFYESDRLSDGYSVKKSELQNALNLSNERLAKGLHDGVKLEQDVVEQQQAFIDDIGSCSISTKIPDLLYEYFIPYFEDESTLEECVEVAQRKMEIYMSE